MKTERGFQDTGAGKVNHMRNRWTKKGSLNLTCCVDNLENATQSTNAYLVNTNIHHCCSSEHWKWIGSLIGEKRERKRVRQERVTGIPEYALNYIALHCIALHCIALTIIVAAYPM